MKAIILAAGRGSRMNGLTVDRPKCLVELQGKPLLEWQLMAIRQAGIFDVAVVTGYKSEQLAGRGLTLFHNADWAGTNMVSSLLCAADWLQSGPCLVSYSDIFYRSSAVNSLMDSRAKLAITYDPRWLSLWEKRFGDPLVDAETFRVDDQGTLLEIGNRPSSIEEVQGQYMGLLRFEPTSFDEVLRICAKQKVAANRVMDMTTLLRKVIGAGRVRIEAIRYEQLWGEVDSTSDLALYEQASM